MSTPNFTTPNYNLPLICGGMNYNDMKQKYEEETGEEYTEDMFYFDSEIIVKNIQEQIDDFNNPLRHFEVVIEPGYYGGFSLNVTQIKDYWDYEEIDDLTDDDSEYFWGDDAETIKKEFKDEMRKIEKFFRNMKNNNDMIELIKVAQFSNGEAVYKEVK